MFIVQISKNPNATNNEYNQSTGALCECIGSTLYDYAPNVKYHPNKTITITFGNPNTLTKQCIENTIDGCFKNANRNFYPEFSGYEVKLLEGYEIEKEIEKIIYTSTPSKANVMLNNGSEGTFYVSWNRIKPSTKNYIQFFKAIKIIINLELICNYDNYSYQEKTNKLEEITTHLIQELHAYKPNWGENTADKTIKNHIIEIN